MDCLALSTGGARGIVHLGFIQNYIENNHLVLDQIHTFVGASVGSAICLLLSIGYSPTDIFKEVCGMEEFFDASVFSRIWDMIINSGLINISSTNIAKKLEELVCKKMGNIPTLKELEDLTKKHLYVVTSNLTRGEPEYLSASSHPNLRCTRAVEMSCNIPIIFQKICLNNQYYADGGLADCFPIVFAQNLPGVTKILGIFLTGPSPGGEKFFDYFYKVINFPINIIADLRLQGANYNNDIAIISLDNSTLLDSKLSTEEKMNLFIRGYSEAKYHKKKEFITL